MTLWEDIVGGWKSISTLGALFLSSFIGACGYTLGLELVNFMMKKWGLK